MITLYGIPNCNTVKKARQWLNERGIEYTFHDFKKAGIDEDRLRLWSDAIGLAQLINRQGTTWRALPSEVKAGAGELPAALALMLDKPAVIKRPVLDAGGRVSIGFDEADWTERLGQ